VWKAHLFISRTRNFFGVLRALTHDLTTIPIGRNHTMGLIYKRGEIFVANAILQIF